MTERKRVYKTQNNRRKETNKKTPQTGNQSNRKQENNKRNEMK